MNLTKYRKSEWIGMTVYVKSMARKNGEHYGFTGKILDHSLNKRNISEPRVLVMPENAGPYVAPKWIDPEQIEVLEA